MSYIVISIRPTDCCIDGIPGQISAPLELSIKTLQQTNSPGIVTLIYNNRVYDIPEAAVEYLVLSDDGASVIDVITPVEIAALANSRSIVDQIYGSTWDNN